MRDHFAVLNGDTTGGAGAPVCRPTPEPLEEAGGGGLDSLSCMLPLEVLDACATVGDVSPYFWEAPYRFERPLRRVVAPPP